MKILVVDIGGSHVKLLASGRRTPRRFDSGPEMTPARMLKGIRDLTADWKFDRVSIGYPGPVRDNRPRAEPANLGPGWLRFNFERAFDCPVRVLNDAAMQALGGYQGGRMLFLGLGTGLGSALIVQGTLQPLELAHLPYRGKKTFEDEVGEAARKRVGNDRWRREVVDVVDRLTAAMQVDSVLIGGGNARRLEAVLGDLPEGTRLGSNADAFRGGFRMWDKPRTRAQRGN